MTFVDPLVVATPQVLFRKVDSKEFVSFGLLSDLEQFKSAITASSTSVPRRVFTVVVLDPFQMVVSGSNTFVVTKRAIFEPKTTNSL